MACLFVLALLLSATSSQTAAIQSPDEPTPEWRRGPVRYLLTLKEDEAFRRLRTTEARRAFIKGFWAGLDPTPDTAQNERRDEFWKRVAQSDLLFRDSLEPGWSTDRGEIYILLGPPDAERHSADHEIWEYEAVSAPDASPPMSFVFFRLPGGGYSLMPDEKRSTPASGRGRAPDPSARTQDLMAKTPSRGPEQFICPGSAPISPPQLPPPEVRRRPLARSAGTYRSGYSGDSGHPQAAPILPGRIRLLPGGSAAEYFFGPLLAAHRFHYYKSIEGATLAILTVAVPAEHFLENGKPSPPPTLVLSATIQEISGAGTTTRLRKNLIRDASWEAPGGDSVRYQAGFVIPPGAYRAEGTIVDERSRRVAIFSENLTLPDYRNGLLLSDIAIGPAPARERPVGGGSGEEAAPFPEPAGAFPSGAGILISYQVYNAVREGHSVDLDANYDFLFKSGEEYQPTGKGVSLPHLKEESLSYFLVMNEWPEGDYRIRVRIIDNLSGNTASREENFRVFGPLRP